MKHALLKLIGLFLIVGHISIACARTMSAQMEPSTVKSKCELSDSKNSLSCRFPNFKYVVTQMVEEGQSKPLPRTDPMPIAASFEDVMVTLEKQLSGVSVNIRFKVTGCSFNLNSEVQVRFLNSVGGWIGAPIKFPFSINPAMLHNDQSGTYSNFTTEFADVVNVEFSPPPNPVGIYSSSEWWKAPPSMNPCDWVYRPGRS